MQLSRFRPSLASPATTRRCAYMLVAVLMGGCGGGGGGGGPPPPPPGPAITSQPAAIAVLAGSTATFAVTAEGTNLGYQWRKNGTTIDGAVASSYTTAPVSGSDDGALYSVRVSGSGATTVSQDARLTVIVQPVITQQPAGVVVTAGATATFSVVATGGAINYQWHRDGVPVNGATTANYTTPATTAADNGRQYSVVVTNAAGSVTSNPALLTVNLATSGRNWGSATALESTDAPVFGAALAINRQTGDGVAVWQQDVNGVNTLYAARYTRSSRTWGAGTRISNLSSAASGQLGGAQAAIHSNGDIVVAWSQVTPSPQGNAGSIRMVRYVASGGGATGWSVPSTVTVPPLGAANSLSGAGSLSMAMDAQGNAVLAWLETYPGFSGSNVAVGRIRAGRTTADTPETIESANNAGDSTSPRVAVDAAGNALVAWFHQPANVSTREIRVTRLLASTQFSTGIQPIVSGLVIANSLDAAIAPTGGNGIIVFEALAGFVGPRNVFFVRYDMTAGSTPEGVQLLESENTTASSPDITMNEAGNAVVAFRLEDVNFIGHIYFARIPAGTSNVSPVIRVDTDNLGADSATIGLAEDGSVDVVWQPQGVTWRHFSPLDEPGPVQRVDSGRVALLNGYGVFDRLARGLAVSIEQQSLFVNALN